MAHDRIPIQLTHAEARAHLEEAHAIDYRESMLGATVYAYCRCGWKSPSVNAGFIAQAAANRHRVAFIEHPLENRARYAIFWKACRGCNGSGRFETRDGVDQGECAHCFEGGLWTILDRTGEDLDRYVVSQKAAIDLLWNVADEVWRQA